SAGRGRPGCTSSAFPRTPGAPMPHGRARPPTVWTRGDPVNRKLTFCTALTASALLAASVQAGMPPTAAATDAGTRTPPQQTLFGSAEQHSQLMESARAAAPDLAR